MAFEVSVKITAESQLEAVKAAEAAVQRVGAASAPAAKAIDSIGVSAGQVRPLLGAMAAQLTAASGTAGALARGLTSLLFTGFTPIGVAIAGTTIAMGVGIEILDRWTREIEKNEAAIKKWSDAQVGAVNILSQLSGQEELLRAHLTGDPMQLVWAERRVAIAAVLKAMADLGIEGARAQQILVQLGTNLGLKEAKVELDEFNKKIQETIRVSREIGKGIEGAGGPVGITLGTQIAEIRKQAGEIFKAGGQVDEATLQRIFSQFQAIKDISQQKFGFDVPPDLAAKLADTEQRLKTIADKAEIKLTVDLLDAGAKFTEVENKLRAISNEAAKGIKFNVDTLAAIGQLDTLRAKAAVPIVQEVKVVTTGSPTLPFSDYFGTYAPGVLRDFADNVGNIGVQLDTNFSQGIVASLARMAELQGILSSQQANAFTRGASVIGDFSAAARGELEALRRNVGFLSSFGGGGGGGGGGGQAGAPITIIINGASPDWLNQLESVLRRSTGRRIGVQVFN